VHQRREAPEPPDEPADPDSGLHTLPLRRRLPMTPRWLLAGLLLGSACEAGPPPPPFDGPAAHAYVARPVGFGPRIPGTEGHRRRGDWLDSLRAARADTVVAQAFEHVTLRGDTRPLRNFLARFRPDSEDRVLLVAHWDTRPR